MLLVYIQKITPRVSYIFKHFFVRTLGIPVSFTTEIAEFVAHSGPKLSYGTMPLGNEFFVHSHELLFDQGINDIAIKIGSWDDVPCFFTCHESSSIPFDIFAASFYLIVRYEEYLPHIQDEHERFSPYESLAYKNGFLELPLVDIWAQKFLEVLIEKYPDYPIPEKQFNMITGIDVNVAFRFKHKGVVRTLGGFVGDLFALNLVHFWNRLLTLLNIKKDSYNTFEKIIDLKQKHDLKMLFFFLIGDYTTFDKNISAYNSNYQSLIKSVADYSTVGLHPSYFAHKNIDKLKREKQRLENIINTPVNSSRQHFLRLGIPETYQHLLDLDIYEDYTMGYEKLAGFRASTCTPFYFYDLDFEIQTPLKIFSFAFSDTTLKNAMGLNTKKSLKAIMRLKEQVQKVNGTFVAIFHNESFSESEDWQGWSTLFEKVMTTT